MNVRKKIITSMLTAAFGSALLIAQGPPPGTPGNPQNGRNPQNGGNPPDPTVMISRRVARLTSLLGLTDAQQQQATKIFTDATTKASTLVTSLRSARTDLKTAIQQNNLNNINAVSATIGNLTAQLTAAEALAQAQFYAILTPDQQTKLNDMESRRRGWFGGGPAGPGGPGMGPRGMGHGPR